MGETAAKLRQIFDIINQSEGIFLFDEFDAIGADRGREDDIGEMRRVLNAFLQFIESDTSDNIIVAATNNCEMLDRALFRRFDDVLHYDLPDPEQIGQLMANRLASYVAKNFNFPKAAQYASGLSQAEVDRACSDAIKSSILADKPTVTQKSLLSFIDERRRAIPTSQ